MASGAHGLHDTILPVPAGALPDPSWQAAALPDPAWREAARVQDPGPVLSQAVALLGELSARVAHAARRGCIGRGWADGILVDLGRLHAALAGNDNTSAKK